MWRTELPVNFALAHMHVLENPRISLKLVSNRSAQSMFATAVRWACLPTSIFAFRLWRPVSSNHVADRYSACTHFWVQRFFLCTDFYPSTSLRISVYFVPSKSYFGFLACVFWHFGNLGFNFSKFLFVLFNLPF